jgi:transposase InsO family protein
MLSWLLDTLRDMTSVLVSFVLTLRDSLRSRAAVQIEMLALRHQLRVLERSRPPRVRLTRLDRLLWVWLSRTWTDWRTALVIVKPETVIAWHRQGFRLFWTWKSRHRTGRRGVPADVRALIREMSAANPRWGAPRIHGELLKLGIDVGQTSVAKYMVRRRQPPSQTWKTFLANHIAQVQAADFFVVPTATYRLLFVLVILAHKRRRIVHVAVTEHPTAAWTTQQVREAFPWDHAPKYLIHDRDHAFDRIAAAMDVQELLTAPRSPWQNAYVERLIGSIRRECLDHVVILNAAGLRRVLTDYVEYYLRSRTHLSLNKDAPVSRAVAPPTDGHIVSIPEVGGLHHRYERRAA